MTKNIVFDCDEVLATFRYSLQRHTANRLGRPVYYNEITSFDIEDVFEELCIHRDVLTPMMLGNEFLYLPVEPYAREVVEAARKEHSVYIVTARGFMDSAHEITSKWFEMNDIVVDEIIIAPPHVSKHTILEDIGNVEIYVDDHPGHVYDAHRTGAAKTSYIMKRPWNVELQKTHPHQIDCLIDLYPLFKEQKD